MNRGVLHFFVLGIFLAIVIFFIVLFGKGLQGGFTGSVILDSKAPNYLPLDKTEIIQEIQQAPLPIIWEDKCASDCSAQINPETICQTFDSTEPNSLCKKCSEACLTKYKGPCLLNEELIARKNECLTIKGNRAFKLISGDSREGYDCAIDSECITMPIEKELEKEVPSKKDSADDVVKFFRDILLWR